MDAIARLKKYRLEVSRTEGIKPYMIFNDKEIEGLMDAKPRNITKLIAVRGFADKKVAKYGDEILKILNA